MNKDCHPIRVMFFEPYPMGLGGNYLTQRLILERLNRNKFHPVVVAPIEGIALERFRAMGVECVVMTPAGDLGRYGGAVLRAGVLRRLKSVLDLIKYNLQLTSFLQNNNIDIIYSNCVRAQLCVGLGAWLAKVPSLLYVKGELANPIIDRLCLLLASRILFFCPQNRDDRYPFLVRLFHRKIAILKIGLDKRSIVEVEDRRHDDLRQELNIDSNRINIVVLGQLYRPKGQHFAIEALSRLVDEFPQVKLYLVGDHVIEEYRPYKAELERLIYQNNLTEHVYFTGWRKDALDIVSLMDIVLHPSLAEGFGRAVLESMALGKPVIASAVGGLRETIHDGVNGYLVEPSNVDMIELRLRYLLSRPDFRVQIGQEAKRTVFSDYLIDDKVDKLANIWKEMIKKDVS